MGIWSKGVRTAIGGLLLAGLLAGCAPVSQEPAAEILWSFEQVPCTVTLAGTEVQGLYSHSLEGVNTFETQQPPSLSGLTVQYRQQEYTIQMAGLTHKRSAGVMDESVFGRLFLALDGACAADLVWEGGQWSGELASGQVVTAETRQDGTLVTLAVPAWQLTVRFSDPEE